MHAFKLSCMHVWSSYVCTFCTNCILHSWRHKIAARQLYYLLKIILLIKLSVISYIKDFLHFVYMATSQTKQLAMYIQLNGRYMACTVASQLRAIAMQNSSKKQHSYYYIYKIIHQVSPQSLSANSSLSLEQTNISNFNFTYVARKIFIAIHFSKNNSRMEQLVIKHCRI